MLREIRAESTRAIPGGHMNDKGNQLSEWENAQDLSKHRFKNVRAMSTMSPALTIARKYPVSLRDANFPLKDFDEDGANYDDGTLSDPDHVNSNATDLTSYQFRSGASEVSDVENSVMTRSLTKLSQIPTSLLRRAFHLFIA